MEKSSEGCNLQGQAIFKVGATPLAFSFKGKRFLENQAPLMENKKETEEDFVNETFETYSQEQFRAFNWVAEDLTWRETLQMFYATLKHSDFTVEEKKILLKSIMGHSDSVTFWPLCLRVESLKISDDIGVVSRILGSVKSEWGEELTIALATNLDENPQVSVDVFYRTIWDKRLNAQLFLDTLPSTDSTWKFLQNCFKNVYLTPKVQLMLICKARKMYPVTKDWLDWQVKAFVIASPKLA